jgi:hypothetical protein
MYCAIINPADRSQVLAGAYAHVGDPQGGGVYTCGETDSVWHYVGLRGLRIFRLVCYPYCRSNLFAATDHGIYMQIEDSTWTSLGGGDRDFMICPSDTSLWVALSAPEGYGSIYISRDSGQHWSWFGGPTDYHPFFWAHNAPQVFYYTAEHTLWRASIPDTIFRPVLYMIDPIQGTAYHPTQPWVYALSYNHIGRYDEVTGDTLVFPLPDNTALGHSIAYTERGLQVCVDGGNLRFSDDLTEWQTDTANTVPGQLLYASPDHCLAINGAGIYVSGVPDAAAPVRPLPVTPVLSVYPNPSNGGFVVTYDRPALLQMYDVLGQEVYSQRIQRPGSVWLDPPGLSSGIYFLKVTNLTGSRENIPPAKIILLK